MLSDPQSMAIGDLLLVIAGIMFILAALGVLAAFNLMAIGFAFLAFGLVAKR